MDKSIFTDKSITPGNKELTAALGETANLWYRIADYVHAQYPQAMDFWSYSGKKYGWSFRIKDKKRAIIYLLPRDKFFKVALVFGKKAFDSVMDSQVAESIKTELNAAKVYAEGRGIRIEVADDTFLKDIMKLVDIKLAF